MRRPTVSEVVLLARVLTRIAPKDRPGAARAILSEADQADVHLQATGQCHARLGDGSLMARCRQLSPPPEPLADDREFLAALVTAALSILAHSKR